MRGEPLRDRTEGVQGITGKYGAEPRRRLKEMLSKLAGWGDKPLFFIYLYILKITDMGRRAKSDKEKKLSGTDRKDRKRRTRISSMPKDIGSDFMLNEYGAKVFDRVKVYLEENSLLHRADTILISKYAYFAQVFKMMLDEMGDNYNSIIVLSDKGNEYMAVSYQVMSNANNQMNALEKVLGIGPYYRQQIRAFDEEAPKEDEVAKLIREMAKTN